MWKIEKYGSRGKIHKLRGNYLQNRRQYVDINGSSTQQVPITTDVPSRYTIMICPRMQKQFSCYFCRWYNTHNLRKQIDNILNVVICRTSKWFALNKLNIDTHKGGTMFCLLREITQQTH